MSLRRIGGFLRVALLVAAALSPLASHFAFLTGQGQSLALALAVLQAAAIGMLAARRSLGLGLALSAALLAVVLGGGLQLAAGVTHALLYSVLLAGFAATLLPGRTEMITGIARRLNPHFHEGMRGYTRAVTWAWCGLFAGQLATSALLFGFAPREWWLVFINFLHLPLVGAMFLGEYLVRRSRYPGGQSTSMASMIGHFRHRPR